MATRSNIIYREPLTISSKPDKKHSTIADGRIQDADIKQWSNQSHVVHQLLDAVETLQKRIDVLEEYIQLHLSKKFATSKVKTELPR